MNADQFESDLADLIHEAREDEVSNDEIVSALELAIAAITETDED